MKKLLILSGKGGTGKTTIAAAFIDFLDATSFADCDVDAPNLHLVSRLNNNPIKTDYYGSQKAKIDSDKCIKCGICYDNCRFSAIFCKNTSYEINEFACEGCGVCELKCPVDAVSMIEDIAGELMLYKDNRVLSTAKLKMGRGNSGKLVTNVKKQLVINASDKCNVVIIDGSPGIGCPVIASISGVDMVLVVAEPSLSGISDMKRILKTAGIFKTRAVVCVNKYDTCIENTNVIEKYCQENNISFLGKIPYDKNVSIAINEGHSIADIECPASSSLHGVFEKIMVSLNDN